MRDVLGGDPLRLYGAALTRALAAGFAGVYLGAELSRRGVGTVEGGAIVGAGLAGHALATLFVTLAGDRAGRRSPPASSPPGRAAASV